MAFFQEPCFKISAISLFNWLTLLVAADLQVCGVYSFEIDVFLKSFFTLLLIESIAATRKGFVVCYELRFRISLHSGVTTLSVTKRFFWFWMFKNMIRWKCDPYICDCHSVYSEKVYILCSFFGLPAVKAKTKVFV